jgi:hypothetical protein
MTISMIIKIIIIMITSIITIIAMMRIATIVITSVIMITRTMTTAIIIIAINLLGYPKETNHQRAIIIATQILKGQQSPKQDWLKFLKVWKSTKILRNSS